MVRVACVLGVVWLAFGAGSATAQELKSELKPYGVLKVNEKIGTPGGRCFLALQGDGNLVWYWRDKLLWHANTHGIEDAELVLQPDGNLVLYGTKDGKRGAVWTTGTDKCSGAFLRCQDDGNLVLYHGEKPVWSTGTVAALPASIKLEVTRTDAWVSSASSLRIYVNNEFIGKINNNEKKTFEVKNARIGKNDLYAIENVSDVRFFSDLIDRDKTDKWAGTKFFAVNRPDEVITLKIGYNDSDLRKNPYEVGNAVPHDWVAPETIKVVFDKKLVREVIKEEPPIRLAAGSEKEYKEEVSVREVVETVSSWKVEADVRAKVSDGWNTLSAGIRGELAKVTRVTLETETKKTMRYTMKGNGSYQKVVYSALYRTGVATVWVRGKEVEVPVKVFEKFDVHPEDASDR